MPARPLLLIDDDAEITRLLARRLAAAGFDVAVASDGLEGLAAFKTRPAEIVVTDVVMPEKEGLETMIALRAASAETLIVAISGNPLYLKLATELAADASLQKPFPASRLVELVLNLPARIG